MEIDREIRASSEQVEEEVVDRYARGNENFVLVADAAIFVLAENLVMSPFEMKEPQGLSTSSLK